MNSVADVPVESSLTQRCDLTEVCFRVGSERLKDAICTPRREDVERWSKGFSAALICFCAGMTEGVTQGKSTIFLEMNKFNLVARKKCKGYTATAKPDYAQTSVGYGTPARYAIEKIFSAEAERRLQGKIAQANASMPFATRRSSG